MHSSLYGAQYRLMLFRVATALHMAVIANWGRDIGRFTDRTQEFEHLVPLVSSGHGHHQSWDGFIWWVWQNPTHHEKLAIQSLIIHRMHGSHYHTYNTVCLVWLSPAETPCCRNKHHWSTYDSPIRTCHEPPWILITNSLAQNLPGWMPPTSGLNHTAAWAANKPSYPLDPIENSLLVIQSMDQNHDLQVTAYQRPTELGILLWWWNNFGEMAG